MYLWHGQTREFTLEKFSTGSSGGGEDRSKSYVIDCRLVGWLQPADHEALGLDHDLPPQWTKKLEGDAPAHRELVATMSSHGSRAFVLHSTRAALCGKVRFDAKWTTVDPDQPELPGIEPRRRFDAVLHCMLRFSSADPFPGEVYQGLHDAERGAVDVEFYHRDVLLGWFERRFWLFDGGLKIHHGSQIELFSSPSAMARYAVDSMQPDETPVDAMWRLLEDHSGGCVDRIDKPVWLVDPQDEEFR